MLECIQAANQDTPVRAIIDNYGASSVSIEQYSLTSNLICRPASAHSCREVGNARIPPVSVHRPRPGADRDVTICK